MTTVAILGCGYVGLELGHRLSTGDSAERVVGVRRSEAGLEAMSERGITPIQGDLTDHATLSELPPVDVVVFAASSGGRGAAAARETYVDGQRTVLDFFGDTAQQPERYIYTSSTGVYGDHDGDWVDEETPLDPQVEREQVLVDAESVAMDRARKNNITPTVIRFAGLYGPDRYRLDRYLDGPVTEGVLNMIHRDDAAGALSFLISRGTGRGERLIAVDNEPVPKWELADWLADQCGLPEPPKQTVAERLTDDSLSTGARRRIKATKRCRNEKLRSLGYELEYPTYREGYRAAIERRDG